MRQVSIVLICDDGYIVPASVALQSMKQSKNIDSFYKVYIVAASLSEGNKSILEQFSKDDFEIFIIEENANRFANLHTFAANAVCVATPSALLKFILPDLLPEEDRVLYLDGDILVNEDLTDLYNWDIGKKLAGVVIDSSSIYSGNKFIELVENYFNSGVMLLNLKEFRKYNISEKLIETKTNLKDSNLMDQNVFNVVLNKQIMLLPIRYNLLAVNLNRAVGKWRIEDINRIYKTNYKDGDDLFTDGAIIHFSSKDKPWKVSNVPFASEWYKIFLSVNGNTILKRHTLNLPDSENIKVSVILPAYNSDEEFYETIINVLAQTLSEIEIICINNKSTEPSFKVSKFLQEKDNRIQIVFKENINWAKLLALGISMAQGEYVLFLDGAILFSPTTLEKSFIQMEKTDADICIFNFLRFEEKVDSEHYRYDFWNKIWRRKNIMKNNLKFEESSSDKLVSFLEINFEYTPQITYFEDSSAQYRRRVDAAILIKKKLIVSLTSYPARIGFVAQTLETIYAQTKKADEVLLWLSNEEFPNHEEEIPAELRQMVNDGKLTIRWCENLKPHKKYFYALQEYKDDLVVTIDDDLVYSPNLLESLYQSYLLYPNAISAARVHLIAMSENNKILPYSYWIQNFDGRLHKPSMQLFATGVGGVLYPPNIFSQRLFNKEVIKETCLVADDLWLKAMELATDIPVVKANLQGKLNYISGSQENGLWHTNVSQNQNDIQVEKIIGWFDKNYGKDFLVKKLTASDIDGTVFLGTQVVYDCFRGKIKNLARSLRELKNSRSYKLGRCILWLPRKVRGGILCLKQNGFQYTVKHFLEKIKMKLQDNHQMHRLGGGASFRRNYTEVIPPSMRITPPKKSA